VQDAEKGARKMTKDMQALLVAAGKMADIAGTIVGESLYSSGDNGAPVNFLVTLLPQLKDAVREYNRLTIKAAK
jgi:hypothetical protein